MVCHALSFSASGFRRRFLVPPVNSGIPEFWDSWDYWNFGNFHSPAGRRGKSLSPSPDRIFHARLGGGLGLLDQSWSERGEKNRTAVGVGTIIKRPTVGYPNVFRELVR
jgi:hypothetical protein